MMDELQATADASQPPPACADTALPSAESAPGFGRIRPKCSPPRRSAILDLLDKGMPNKLIARNLAISGETVKWHLKNVYHKLSVGSRRHAVERARVLGLVQ